MSVPRLNIRIHTAGDSDHLTSRMRILGQLLARLSRAYLTVVERADALVTR